MFKRTLLALAVIGMVSSPALADLTGTPKATPKILTHVSSRGVGPGAILGNYSISANVSSSVVVTFSLQWPYITYTSGGGVAPFYVFANGVNYSFAWDATEVSITGFMPVAPFAGAANFSAATAPALLNGLLTTGSGQVGVFTQDVTTSFKIGTATIVPFLKVTLHVKNQVAADGLLDAHIAQAATSNGGPAFSSGMVWNYVVTTTVPIVHSNFSSVTGGTVNMFRSTVLTPNQHYITGGGVFAFGGNYGVDITPEPASAAMLGMGILTLTGGIWRRRRRLHS